MRSCFFTFILISILSCKKDVVKGKKTKIDEAATTEKLVEIKADSLHKSFLLSATYKTALKYNNTPYFEGEFLLNEKKLGFALSGLNNVFSEEEKLLPIPIKEVVWTVDGINFVSVMYRKEGEVLKPIDFLEYTRDTKW